MDDETHRRSPVLIVVAGPIASGKSTVAKALAEELRRRGGDIALVGLDEIAEMALPTLPSWQDAHAIFSSVAGQWLRTPLTGVVAEGPGTPAEVDGLVEQAPSGTPLVRVILTSPFDAAFVRAQADPTRGVSRQREFLARVYERWAQTLPNMTGDVLIDTATTSVEQSVETILSALPGISG